MRLAHILIFMLLPIPVSAQAHASLSVSPHAPEPLFATSPAALDSGDYVILNAHSNQAIGSQQMFGALYAAQFDTAAAAWQFEPTEGGKYKIRSSAGYLKDSPGYSHVAVSDAGSGWDVQSIDGADTFVIRGPSGRVLEVYGWRTISGSWLVMAEQAGGSNQEWRISRPSTVMTAAPNPQMHVRGSGRFAMATGTVRHAPRVTWSKDAAGYVYQIHADDPHLVHIRLDRGSGYEAVEAAAPPPGWHFALHGWFADAITTGVSGDFAMRSSWAPGPVIMDARTDGDRAVSMEGVEDPKQYRAAILSKLYRGSHFWTLGPAIPPQTDAAGLRKLIGQWVINGLAFLDPLAQTDDLRVALDQLRPRDDFERQLVSALRLAIQQ